MRAEVGGRLNEGVAVEERSRTRETVVDGGREGRNGCDGKTACGWQRAKNAGRGGPSDLPHFWILFAPTTDRG